MRCGFGSVILTHVEETFALLLFGAYSLLGQGCHHRHLQLRRSNPSIIPTRLRHRQHYLSISYQTHSMCRCILSNLNVFKRTIFRRISQIAFNFLLCRRLPLHRFNTFVQILFLTHRPIICSNRLMTNKILKINIKRF